MIGAKVPGFAHGQSQEAHTKLQKPGS